MGSVDLGACSPPRLRPARTRARTRRLHKPRHAHAHPHAHEHSVGATPSNGTVTEHAQFFNIGDVPTDAIVVVGVGSKIWDGAGNEMQLPWRK